MKQQTTIEKKPLCEIDKRELVNIDLYHHEMKVIAGRLNQIADKHPGSKEIQLEVEQFKKGFRRHKKSLEKLRKDCGPDGINTRMQTGKKGEEIWDKGFFEKMNDFENKFSPLREDANCFMNKWEHYAFHHHLF